MVTVNVCKNCGNQFRGKYCNNCGEKIYDAHDKTFRHFLDESLHFLTHFDSKFLTSWWLVMTKPGFISEKVAGGVRKPFFPPLNLFILGIILYLVFPFFQGLNAPMQQHTYTWYGPVAASIIKAKAENNDISVEELGRKYDAKSPKFAKVILLIVVPMCSLILALIFRGEKRYFFDHLTLAAELNSFFLYFTFFIIPLIFMITLWLQRLLAGERDNLLLGDNVSIPLYLSVFGIYSSFAFKRFYKVKPIIAIIKSVLFLSSHAFIVYIIYRFILFCVVQLFI